MIPEIGLFCLILAFSLALLQGIFSWAGLQKNRVSWMRMAGPLSLGQGCLISVAFLILLYAFVQDDFSVRVVAEHSHSALPLQYKIAACWGGHTGSWLLWLWLLNLWLLCFGIRARRLPIDFSTGVFALLGLMNACFLAFLLKLSNPFERLWPMPLDGLDLNPLLQDQGLMVHPPLLYLGNVGLMIPFAMSLALLWRNQAHSNFAQWIRPWVLACFAFLSIGIGLGSWWAYHELGWGGWWFWDPVESASLLPWLLSIGLIHSLMSTHKRSVYRRLTLLLCLLAFGSHLMGLFLVRSGVLMSIHAFATDPKRGVFLLGLMVLLLGGGLFLYHFRSKRWMSQNPMIPQSIAWFSREFIILIGVVLLLVATGSILLGIVFPLFYEVIFGQKISVGFPYFNKVFIPLVLPVLCLVPLGPLMRWGANDKKAMVYNLYPWLLMSLLLAFMLPIYLRQDFSFFLTIVISIGIWILLGTFKVFLKKIAYQISNISHLSFGAWGMLWAHGGAGVLVIGIGVLSQYQIDRDVYMRPGQSLNIGHQSILFKDLKTTEGSNYVAHQAHFILNSHTVKPHDLWPEKRVFVVQSMRTTEAAIASKGFNDIYIALGELLRTDYWSVRICYKPFIQWVWAGIIMMTIGGFLSMIGRRCN